MKPLHDNMGLEEFKNKVTAAGKPVIMDEYDNFAGETVYLRGWDNEDGTHQIAIAYLGDENTINEQNNYHTGLLRRGLASSGITGTEFNDIYNTQAAKNSYTLESLPNVIPADPLAQVQLAWDMYHKYHLGPIRTYVNFLTDIAVDGLKHRVDHRVKNHQAYEEFYDTLMFENLDLVSKVQAIFLDLFCCSNSYTWVTHSPYTPNHYNDLMEIPLTSPDDTGKSQVIDIVKAVAEKRIEAIKINGQETAVFDVRENCYLSGTHLLAYAARKERWSKKQLPQNITCMNPRAMTVEGGTFKGTREYKYMLDPQSANKIKDNPGSLKPYLNTEVIRKINEQDFNLRFTEREINHIKMREHDCLLYGEPNTLGALAPLSARIKKQKAAEQASDKLIRQILLVTVGDKEFPATKKQLAAAASLVKNAGSSFTIVFNHTMKIQSIVPQGIDTLISSADQTDNNNQIYEALNFPIFLSGMETETNFGTGTYNLRPLIHLIHTARGLVYRKFLLPLYRSVEESMDMPRNVVLPEFNINILEDPNQVAKRIQGYVTTKMMSVGTAISKSPDNMDEHQEKEKMREELPDLESGTFGQFKPAGVAGRPEGDPSPSSVDRTKMSPKGDGSKPNQKTAQDDSAQHFPESVITEIVDLVAQKISTK